MKKIVIAAVSAAMMFGMVACGSSHGHSCDGKGASAPQLAAFEQPQEGKGRKKKSKKKVVVHRRVVIHKHVHPKRRHHSSHHDDDC